MHNASQEEFRTFHMVTVVVSGVVGTFQNKYT